mgnify:CR=1 FL=1
MKRHSFKAKVKKFSGKGGWHYVDVPDELVIQPKQKNPWGFIYIEAELDNVKWTSNLLPKGNGHYFIPLKATIRKKTGISLGDSVSLRFSYIK